ncbi:Alpha-D-ribose 1-methylphosphonate 5-triphosphate diphosphatase [bioreactor metagenome]|uniref:Alpha-D-ribose 1-methylphosphonate 5-triphosphate diphosphatase n=1 Tax=bioreactor metagenome TaxID=1076179 RepID=A0A644W0V1_9ZZZZ|nr:phosphonate metabolism protein PhnM [Acidaminococcaceae bacterium]
MYLITNGQVVTETEILNNSEVLIDGENIVGIYASGTNKVTKLDTVINAEEGLIAPGFVDIHSDYIENMASPRPTSVLDFDISIRETEKILINQGITTMFHSLSFIGEDEFSVKPIRSPENVKALLEKIAQTHNRLHLIRHRFHARLEIDAVDNIEQIKQFILAGKVQLLSFMDHSPGQGQYRNLEIYRKTLKGYKKITDNEIDKVIAARQGSEKMTLAMIQDIAELAHRKNIAIASHDDDTLEKIEFLKQFGATISEFPITIEVAKAAKAAGMLTLVGAPNILLGGSHSGNMSAAQAINEGVVDILCSDYYPAALLHAIFIMHEQYGQDLAKMFRLVTLNPAVAVKMDREIGSIVPGKKADVLIINKIEGDFPVITCVMVDGKVITQTNYRV